MTTTEEVRAAGRLPRRSETSRGDSLTGTGTLIRFNLRRDRIKLPAWVFGITVMGLYYASALPQVYKTPEDLRAVSQFSEGTVGALISGPGYGLAEPTVESVIVAVYGLYFLLLAALMNILLISRHTRVEEQTGCAELVRANVVGRHAQLTAALLVALAANVALSLFIAGSFSIAGLDSSDSLLFGCSVGATGLVFAAITAITVQISTYSRAAAGMAGAALGIAYVIRAAGDTLREGGSALSWLSPLAWSQQTRAYADGRWWPLALSIVFAVAACAVGYALSARRDVGAGLVAARRGSPVAPDWLRSPLALAFRLQRAGLIGWGCALAAAGALYGGISKQIVESFDDLPDQVVDVMGGDPTRMLDGYAGTMALFNALLVAVFGILGVQSLRGEETSGRAEPVLATATGRWAWIGSYTAVLAAGAVALLALSGAVLGASMALSVGQGRYLADVLVAHLVFAPAVLVVIAVAVLCYGAAPRLIGITWALLGFSMIIGFFGPIMDLPRWLHNLSPFEHVARVPMDDVRWAALVVMTVLAIALAGAGSSAFRRRDLDMK
ncbi:ABC transporter permease [Nocardia cyriacigeorgica]|uniref:ABC transporter permease n=1 Tax=Nocardia cyriacigeorgica TaxID=135487 RepID=UPI00249132E4|nr:ABC transporter permease [Nocardia cyriacigeorgica]BDU05185.1 exporter of polyketide antibiotics [Nocardia cyriacigeorgica]